MEYSLSDLTLAEPNRTNLQRSRRTSDMSTLSTDISLGKYLRDSSPIDEDPQSVISSTQYSPWEEMMIEAEEEDS